MAKHSFITKGKTAIAAAALFSTVAFGAAPASAGLLSALGTWLSTSAACAALIAPPAQLVCAAGAGILTGVAAITPTP